MDGTVICKHILATKLMASQCFKYLCISIDALIDEQNILGARKVVTAQEKINRLTSVDFC